MRCLQCQLSRANPIVGHQSREFQYFRSFRATSKRSHERGCARTTKLEFSRPFLTAVFDGAELPQYLLSSSFAFFLPTFLLYNYI